VFKTTDGGKTWKKVLYVDADTGCSDLSMDPQEPGILYAGMWSFRRYPDFFNSGGKGSGLYKSTDGGESWKRLDNGFPKGELGRVAVVVAPSRAATVYALVESKDKAKEKQTTALYRSDASANCRARRSTSRCGRSPPPVVTRTTCASTSRASTISTDGGRASTTCSPAARAATTAITRSDPPERRAGPDGDRRRALHLSAAATGLSRNLPLGQFTRSRSTTGSVQGLRPPGQLLGRPLEWGINNADWSASLATFPDAKSELRLHHDQGGVATVDLTGVSKDIKPYADKARRSSVSTGTPASCRRPTIRPELRARSTSARSTSCVRRTAATAGSGSRPT
jgi:hypothetical protein